jgi:acetyl esterase/lipase
LFALVQAARAAVPETTPESLPGSEPHVYRALEPVPLRLHVFKPAGWNASDARPAFVFFFGGGWTTGTPARAGAAWARVAAEWGMVGIAPDYRTRRRFDTSPLEAVADARAAVRWVQEHANELGVDPARIVVGGNSAGGHVALWTGIGASPPGSSADESPVSRPVALVLTSAVSDTSLLSGYTPARFGEHAMALSPLHQLDDAVPPVLAFHGDADKTVPYAQAVALHERLRAMGRESELVTVPGGSHGYANDLPEWRDETRERVREFLSGLGLVD